MKIVCDCGKEVLFVPCSPWHGSELERRDFGIYVEVTDRRMTADLVQGRVDRVFPLLITCGCGRRLIAVEDLRRPRAEAA